MTEHSINVLNKTEVDSMKLGTNYMKKGYILQKEEKGNREDSKLNCEVSLLL